MGLTQCGRSRTWIDDRSWWLGVAEFQPSGWSKGSYLNVGCCWLWPVKSHLTFDVGHGVQNFVAYESDRQFAPLADALAESAAREIRRYRDEFQNILSVCQFYEEHPPTALWPDVYAAIANGLAGRTREAEDHFSKAIQRKVPNEPEWQSDAIAVAEELVKHVGTRSRFQGIVEDHIRTSRRLMKLGDVGPMNFGIPDTAVDHSR